MYKLLAIVGGATLLYAVQSTLMAVIPGFELAKVPPGHGVEQLTMLQQHGRDVYVSEGCAYCHTQQVRPQPVDSAFGRPSAPGDFAYQTPELLGSERNGPDLTNIGKRQPSDVWQYMHLYNPRSVVPQSIMPAFPFLFKVVDKAPKGESPVPIPKAFAPKHGVVIPTEDAKALFAYLLSLKQPDLPNAKGSGTTVSQATPSTKAPASTAAAAKAGGQPPAAGATSAGAMTFNAAEGKTLFAANCAACHGAQGAGVPGVFPDLHGNAVVNDKDATEHITVVLEGLHGKAIDGTTYSAQMPAFAGQLSDEQIADIIDHERTSWGNHGATIAAKDVAAVRAKLKK